MVFESVVKEILNRYLGAYVENLDANQLNVGIWSGEDFCLHVLYIRWGATTSYLRSDRIVDGYN